MTDILELKYSDILKLNQDLETTLQSPDVEIDVFSNIIIAQLKEILEYTLRNDGINAKITIRDYDNIVQESYKVKNSKIVIIFWELSNLIDGFHFKHCSMPDNKIETLIEKVIAEINVVLNQLRVVPLVIFNKFSSLVFSESNLRQNRYERVCDRLNEYLSGKIAKNIVFVDIDKIISKSGLAEAIDLRYFYSSKALYSIQFFKNYSTFIKPIILSLLGKAKKVLILDCDNTLWKGILGEDGLPGIEMSAKTNSGVFFEEVQSIVLELSKRGILIGLCSKNNPEDVNEVLHFHPDMMIRDSDLVIKRINWSDKSDNLKQIAEELNIGLDSIVFVDDSDFEVNLIKVKIPQISVFQVPKKLHEYPRLMRNISNLFFTITESKEDLKRTEMYVAENQRKEVKLKYDNLERYLESLHLQLQISMDDEPSIARLAQLSQKTNQCNLTTRRYSESDIELFVKSPDYKVFSFEVSDKFGSYGITGLSIIKMKPPTAEIDTFLMSCRILGRNIEKVFIDHIINELSKMGVKIVTAQYIKSIKNKQVENFYNELKFDMTLENNVSRRYSIDINKYKFNNIKYIEVLDGRKDNKNHVSSFQG